MNADTKKYYRALIKSFGCAEYSGCLNLAKLLSLYDNKINLQDLYNVIAEENSSTPTAVERSIRIYLKAIIKGSSLEDLSLMLGYVLKPNQTSISIGAFVPVFKFLVDEESETTES